MRHTVMPCTAPLRLFIGVSEPASCFHASQSRNGRSSGNLTTQHGHPR